jgi:hypothetical protein
MRFTTGLTLLAAVGLSACTTTVVNTNRTVDIPSPTIAVYDTVGAVEIGEKVSGSGCASSTLLFGERWLDSSSATYLEVHGTASSGIENRAKAIATHQALTNGKGLTTDILVYPVWEITRQGGLFSLWREQVCANVVGFRGVVKSFKTLETTEQFKLKQKQEATTGQGFFGRF